MKVVKPSLDTTLPWKPFPKERPRGRVAGKNVIIYTPSATKRSEADLAKLFLASVGDDFMPLEGPLGVELGFDDDSLSVSIWSVPKHQSKLRGDIDNYAKTALDALNGLAFVDDRYIEQLILNKH